MFMVQDQVTFNMQSLNHLLVFDHEVCKNVNYCIYNCRLIRSLPILTEVIIEAKNKTKIMIYACCVPSGTRQQYGRCGLEPGPTNLKGPLHSVSIFSSEIIRP